MDFYLPENEPDGRVLLRFIEGSLVAPLEFEEPTSEKESEISMHKSLGLFLILVSLLVAGGVAAVSFKADYWLLSPKEKFLTSWQEDVRLLRKTHSLPAAWDHLRDVEVKSDNSPALDWIDSLKKRISLDPAGTYKLNVMVIHWIEKTKYGAIVQYSITDTRSGNTIWEMSRTLHLGYLL